MSFVGEIREREQGSRGHLAPVSEEARLCVLCEARYGAQAQPAGLIRALERRGRAVDVSDPGLVGQEVGAASRLAAADLVVARGRSHPVLAELLLAELRGVATINARAAVDAVRNKLDMAIRLAAAGVPVPPTWAGRPVQLARRVPRSAYPIVLKPIFGDNAVGLALVRDARELADLRWPAPAALAQRWLAGDGRDLKLYGIGERMFAVRKPSPFRPDREAACSDVEPVSLTPELIALGERCRRLFGLELLGIDCIETADGPVVIEVNEFPNYTGVTDADELLADYVLGRLPDGRSGCGSGS
jgi:ribosomal protein S6--L-glutamate ligase